ncbi:MAG: alpha/beta hydrolase [Prolixibacteraceae bacterium]|nr:alpha/beta hydrolase [Prolixibacteraceae bacterium]
MKKYIFAAFFMMFCITSFSQKKMIELWPDKVPGEIKAKSDYVIASSRNDNVLRISEVTDPKMEVFIPGKMNNKHSAVIVCPGGGYNILAYDLEGTEIVQWLNKLGYAAFLLQYRVPDKRVGALQDLQRAIRIVRNDAAKWDINPQRIGVIGFSAGGSLCARASTLYNKETYSPIDKADKLSCRPSYVMLIYPAYLDLGENHSLTPELKLTKEVPPFFMFQASDDPYGNSSLVMGKALRDAKLPFEMHIVPTGGHGYGLRPGKLAPETWPSLAERWMSVIIKD